MRKNMSNLLYEKESYDVRGCIYEIYKKYKDLGKPIIAQFQGGPECVRVNNWLKDRGIPSYPTPEQAIAAMAALTKYAEIKRKFS